MVTINQDMVQRDFATSHYVHQSYRRPALHQPGDVSVDPRTFPRNHGGIGGRIRFNF